MIRQTRPLPISPDAQRRAAFEDEKVRHRRFHRRLEVVEEGIAWCNGRDVPNRADVAEARAQMWPEYMRLFADTNRVISLITQ